ncbi:hypothetical protein TNCV_860521 [Trichonephila clavipes]|nr:hypothetical protein TNCV_860521 [Trichonephila clavipes]
MVNGISRQIFKRYMELPYLEIFIPDDPDQDNGTKLRICHRFLTSVQNFELIGPFKVSKNRVQRFRHKQLIEDELYPLLGRAIRNSSRPVLVWKGFLKGPPWAVVPLRKEGSDIAAYIKSVKVRQ